MRPNFKRYDGSKREPRPVQQQYLDWLADGWDEASVHAGSLPTATGKSFLARSIELATRGHTVTPSNILIEQYCATYPKHNYLMGKKHYVCRSTLSCLEWTTTLEQETCEGCPYQSSRDRAQKESTFFNPMSLLYFRLMLQRKQIKKRFPVLIVDEAHQLPHMLLLMAGKKFRYSLYKFNDNCHNEIYLIQWLENQYRKLDKLVHVYKNSGDFPKLQDIIQEFESIGLLLESLKDCPENYAIYTEDGFYRGRPDTFLNVRPIRPPKNIVKRLLDCDKLILLSGTLMPADIEDLSMDRPSRFIDLPSPIPKENRPILYRPAPFRMNYETDPATVVKWIEGILERYPNRNTIIHTTYSQAQKLAPRFKRPVLTNNAENKSYTLDKFKREGGVFLASGCAEGIDLHGDLCRLNIIPRLNYPNLQDPTVQKRKALTKGDSWYQCEALKNCIQQAGRSTRHEKDHSITVIGDPQFARLVSLNQSLLPKSFVEAIQWQT